MTSGVETDASWGALSELDPTARQQAMEERFARLASRAEDDRLREIEAMVRAEYALPDEALHAFTASRLRAWIALEQRDPAQAQAAARGYDRIFDQLPAQMAMRRASVVQTVARATMTADEIESLFDLIPSLVRQVPRAKQDLARNEASQRRVEEMRTRTTDHKKPFWKFW